MKVSSAKTGLNPGKAPAKGALDEKVQRATKAAAKQNRPPRHAGRDTQPDHPPQKRRGPVKNG